MKTDPMTEQEFSQSMDSLIEKGLVEVGVNEHGEVGFIPTPLGREIFAQLSQEEAHGNSTDGSANARTQ